MESRSARIHYGRPREPFSDTGRAFFRRRPESEGRMGGSGGSGFDLEGSLGRMNSGTREEQNAAIKELVLRVKNSNAPDGQKQRLVMGLYDMRFQLFEKFPQVPENKKGIRQRKKEKKQEDTMRSVFTRAFMDLGSYNVGAELAFSVLARNMGDGEALKRAVEWGFGGAAFEALTNVLGEKETYSLSIETIGGDATWAATRYARNRAFLAISEAASPIKACGIVKKWMMAAGSSEKMADRETIEIAKEAMTSGIVLRKPTRAKQEPVDKEDLAAELRQVLG
jgi:hypothetical protein